MTTHNERDLEALLRECYEWLFESKTDGPRVSEGAIAKGYYTEAFAEFHNRLQAALIRERREGVCLKCNGAGGERWHEADGSENGQRCDACDGFGTQQEAPGAVACAEDAGEFSSDTAALAFLRLTGNGNPNVERAVERLRLSLTTPQSGDGVVVPREPTEAMLDAALRLQGDDAFLAKAPAVLSAFGKIYRAMIAAAPSAKGVAP